MTHTPVKRALITGSVGLLCFCCDGASKGPSADLDSLDDVGGAAGKGQAGATSLAGTGGNAGTGGAPSAGEGGAPSGAAGGTSNSGGTAGAGGDGASVATGGNGAAGAEEASEDDDAVSSAGTGGAGEGGDDGAGASSETNDAGLDASDSGDDDAEDDDADVSLQCPPNPTASPGESTKTVLVDGRSREFVLHIPSGYTGDIPLPVVIDFHPLGGSGPTWKGSAGWGPKADADNFIVVWPSGVGNSWNVGRCCSTARADDVDDVAFTRAIIDTLATEACVDTRRVYATGCSNGGGMAYKVACDAADVIAAVAPVDFDCVAGPSPEQTCCAPARPISAIQFRGTNDTAVPYNGGPGPIGEVTFPGAETNFSDWGEINECTGAPAPLAENDSCQSYSGCEDGVETTLCTVREGSHCGSYGSFGIVDVAWSRLKESSL